MPVFILCTCVAPAPVSGAFAILNLRGGTATQTSEFNYATEALVNGTNLAQGTPCGGARSNANAIFLAGANGNTDKYNLSTKAVTQGGSLAFNPATVQPVASWYTSTQGFFGGVDNASGFVANALYQFGSDVFLQASSLGSNQQMAAGFGSTAVAYVAGGSQGGVSTACVTTTRKIKFADGSVAGGTALGTARCQQNNGLCDYSFGYVAGGPADRTAGTACASSADRYNIAADTVAAGTNLGVTQGGAACASGSSYGIMAGGWPFEPGAPVPVATILKYNFSTQAITTSATAVAGNVSINWCAV